MLCRLVAEIRQFFLQGRAVDYVKPCSAGWLQRSLWPDGHYPPGTMLNRALPVGCRDKKPIKLIPSFIDVMLNRALPVGCRDGRLKHDYHKIAIMLNRALPVGCRDIRLNRIGRRRVCMLNRALPVGCRDGLMRSVFDPNYEMLNRALPVGCRDKS